MLLNNKKNAFRSLLAELVETGAYYVSEMQSGKKTPNTVY